MDTYIAQMTRQKIEESFPNIEKQLPIFIDSNPLLDIFINVIDKDTVIKTPNLFDILSLDKLNNGADIIILKDTRIIKLINTGKSDTENLYNFFIYTDNTIKFYSLGSGGFQYVDKNDLSLLDSINSINESITALSTNQTQILSNIKTSTYTTSFLKIIDEKQAFNNNYYPNLYKYINFDALNNGNDFVITNGTRVEKLINIGKTETNSWNFCRIQNNTIEYFKLTQTAFTYVLPKTT